MNVLVTRIKENLYVFSTKDFHSSELESEFLLDDFSNRVKAWIMDRLNQESVTYVMTVKLSQKC